MLRGGWGGGGNIITDLCSQPIDGQKPITQNPPHPHTHTHTHPLTHTAHNIIWGSYLGSQGTQPHFRNLYSVGGYNPERERENDD